MLRTRFALLGICCAPLLAGAASTACGDKKGGLMLSISTDMKAPKDVSVVSLTILSDNQVKFNFLGRVLPNGDVKLPATIAIAEADASTSIRIRAIAFQERKPRVLRDVRTSIPHGGRVALLRLPLNFIDDGSASSGALTPEQLTAIPATGTLPPDPLADAGPDAGGTPAGTADTGGFGSGELDPYSQFDSICGAGDELTQIDGVCVDSTVDSDALPDFDPSLVGDGQDTTSCFDVKKCLAGAQTITGGNGDFEQDAGKTDVPDASTGGGGGFTDAGSGGDFGDAGKFKADPSPMSGGFDAQRCLVDVQGRDLTKLNLALQTQGTGECLSDGRCFVPLDHGDHGWREAGTVIQLAPGICKKIAAGGVSLVEVDTGVCAPKVESAPVCNLGEPTAASDGGTTADGGTSVDAGTVVPRFLIGEDFVADVIGSFDGVYFASRNRVASFQIQAPGTITTPQNVGDLTTGIFSYRFSERPSGGVVLIDGSRKGYIINGTGFAMTTLGDTGGGAVAVEGATTNPIWSTIGTEQAGLWETVEGSSSILFPYMDGFTMDPIQGNISALYSPGGAIFVIGTQDGQLRGCNDNSAGNTCGKTSKVSTGQIDAFSQHLVDLGTDMVDLYSLTRTGLFHGTGNIAQGTVVSQPVPGVGSTLPLVADGVTYPRGISREIGKCVFVATANGLEWVTPDNKSGVLVSTPSTQPVLGVSIARVGGVGVSVVFNVYGPKTNGGGIYEVDVPTFCMGP